MLQIFLYIAEALLGFVAAVVFLVAILIIIGQFVREHRERVEEWHRRRFGTQISLDKRKPAI